MVRWSIWSYIWTGGSQEAVRNSQQQPGYMFLDTLIRNFRKLACAAHGLYSLQFEEKLIVT